MKKRFLSWLVFIALILFQTNANALEFLYLSKNGKQVLLFEGSFAKGDSFKFSESVRRVGRIDEIWFDSGGGIVVEGIEIGRKIRSLGLATKIPNGAQCLSICAFAFLGGVIREIDPGGVFGVHMFSTMCSEETVHALAKEITSIVKKEGDKGSSKIVDRLIKTEQYSANLARDQADYLLEMEISLRMLFPNYETPCYGIKPLTRKELIAYNVINTGF